jgi:hypothetical protein
MVLKPTPTAIASALRQFQASPPWEFRVVFERGCSFESPLYSFPAITIYTRTPDLLDLNTTASQMAHSTLLPNVNLGGWTTIRLRPSWLPRLTSRPLLRLLMLPSPVPT